MSTQKTANYQLNQWVKSDRILMDARKITRNRLRTLTGIKYDVIDRYYKGQDIALVDLDFLAKICYVLDCRVEDLLHYEQPEQKMDAL